LDWIDQRFRLWLRRQGYDSLQQRALLAITPTAAARLGSIARFLEQVAYNGRRLAKLNVPPAAVTEALQYFDSLCQAEFQKRFAAERDQLQLATRLVLENAFYQVREAEAQAFFGLYRAECEAAGLDDLLRRIVEVMAQAFQAAAGRLLLTGTDGHELSEPLYVERGQPQERLIADPDLRGRYASYWSYPFGTSAVMQLGFRVPYPWLPREQTLLAAAAARCQQAIERARMAEDLRRLEAQARQAEEEERKRIGRDLHDEAGQTMAFLRLQLEMMERDAPEPLRPRLAEACDLAARTTVELRRIVAALSPSVLDRLGLETALRQLVAAVRTPAGFVFVPSCVTGSLSQPRRWSIESPKSPYRTSPNILRLLGSMFSCGRPISISG
jgi:signal transduction histidine kinase